MLADESSSSTTAEQSVSADYLGFLHSTENTQTTQIPVSGSLYLSITPKFYTKVLHQTLNPTAELWCKTFSRIKVDLVLHRT